METPASIDLQLGQLFEMHKRIEGTLVSLQQEQVAVATCVREIQGIVTTLEKRELGPDDARRRQSNGSESRRPTPADRRSGGRRSRRGSVASGNEVVCQDSGENVNTLPSLPYEEGFVAPTLPYKWPKVLERRPSLDRTHRPSYNMNSQQMVALRTTGGTTSHGLAGSWRMSSEFGSRCGTTIDPNGSLRMGFDALGILMLMYDLTVVPLLLAFDIEFDGAIQVSLLLTGMFWTVELCLNFMTGYNKDGSLVSEPAKVAKHYFNGWFLPDLVVIMCDWFSTLATYIMRADHSSRSLKLLRLAKLGRIMRVVGLFRMFRLFKAVEEFMEVRLTENTRIALRFSSVVFGIVGGIHLVSCTWYGVGRFAPSDTGWRWMDTWTRFNGEDGSFEELPQFYQYMTAFHWSVAQVTLGSIDVACANSFERIFNVMCLLLGLIAGSTLVSSLSATMVEMQMVKKDQKQKMRQLRQYLRDSSVNRSLGVLVQQQVSARLRQRTRLLERDVPALQLLSGSLRAELRLDTFRPHLLSQPLFRLWSSMDPPAVSRIATSACEFKCLIEQDELFSAGTKAETAYFLVQGNIQYTQEPDTSPVDLTTDICVVPGAWMCEACLWSEWIHVGAAEGLEPCELITIDADGLSQAVQRSMKVNLIYQEYGRAFHRQVVSSAPPNTAWPSDLSVPCTEYADIVCAMPKAVQVQIGLSALTDALSSHHGFAAAQRGFGHRQPKGLEKLREEVRTGKSTVMMNGHGEVERVTSVIALRVRDVHGERLLAQLAKTVDSEVVGACQLPGGKQEQGELPADAMQRLLEAKLAPLVDCLQHVSVERQVAVKDSQEFGVRTKYLRTVYHASLEQQLQAPMRMLLLPKHHFECGRRLSVTLPAMPANPTEFFTGHKELHEVRQPVYVFSDKGKDAFYTWLTPLQFDTLSGAAGHDALQHWIEALKIHIQENPAPKLGTSSREDQLPAVVSESCARQPGFSERRAI